eukprot:5281522-Pyramimonas_sp.AAC.1
MDLLKGFSFLQRLPLVIPVHAAAWARSPSLSRRQFRMFHDAAVNGPGRHPSTCNAMFRAGVRFGCFKHSQAAPTLDM